MRDMMFYNERDFWLEDDETEYHVRAFYKHGWITGYFPAGHTYVHRNRCESLQMSFIVKLTTFQNRQDKRAHNLVRSFSAIEAMRGQVMTSLNQHCNRSYIDSFPVGFPHNNHVREVTPELMMQAKVKCSKQMKRDSQFCSLHC